jgi:hypothetical protein
MNGTAVVERWKDERLSGTRLVDRSVGDTEPIGSYGLLADCNTAALISRNGSVDWVCFPRYDYSIRARATGQFAPLVGRQLTDATRAGHW